MLKESVESYYGGRMSGDATSNGLFETIPSIKQYISKIIEELGSKYNIAYIGLYGSQNYTH